MKKVLTILILGLAILAFSGCENQELKQGRLDFIEDAMTFGKARTQKIAEVKYGKEVVAKWIKELEDKGEWIDLVKCKEDFRENYGAWEAKMGKGSINQARNDCGDIVDEWIKTEGKELSIIGNRPNFLKP